VGRSRLLECLAQRLHLGDEPVDVSAQRVDRPVILRHRQLDGARHQLVETGVEEAQPVARVVRDARETIVFARWSLAAAVSIAARSRRTASTSICVRASSSASPWRAMRQHSSVPSARRAATVVR
jgi:hypothetical protein